MDADPPAGSSKRRSTRTATAKKRKPESDPSGSSVPAPKKSRTSKKGRLAGLLSISLDVVFEIFGNLHPLDVLRLSRTSKEFRQLLMHNLSNVQDMPSCPPNMTEPQWIALAFDAVCQVCQKIARKVDWNLYVRICSKCAKTCLAHRPYGMNQRLAALNRSLLPTQRPSLALDFVDLIPTRRENVIDLYFPPELEKVKAAYNAIKDPKNRNNSIQHTYLCETWAENIADNRSAELADRKERRYDAVVARLQSLGWGAEIAGMLPRDSLRSHKLVKAEMINQRLAREYTALVVARKVIASKVLRTFKRSQLPIMLPSSANVDEQTFEALLPDFPEMIATWREGLVAHMVGTYKRGSDDTISDNVAKDRLKLATSVFKCSSCGNGSDIYFDDLLSYGGGSYHKGCRPLYYPNALAHRCLTRVPDYSMALMLLSGDMSKDCVWRSTVLKFDKDTAGYVEKIVRACGLDPATATVADMDAADKRLACHACAVRGAVAEPVVTEGGAFVTENGTSSASSASKDTKGKGKASDSAASAPTPSASKDKKGKGKAPDPADELEPATVLAYDWRGAVRHHGEKHSHFPTAWFMLSDADADAARALEAVAIEESKKQVPKTTSDTLSNMSDSDSDEGAPAPAAGPSTSTAANPSVNQDEPMEEAPAATDKDTDMVAPTPTPTHPGPPLPSQLPELAFSCAHCIDLSREPAPSSLKGMREHLQLRHEVFTTPVLNEDYY
ncbi:hypothetical protein K438DRAFT_1799507, partial [Mycena galopus ATCC 62051]